MPFAPRSLIILAASALLASACGKTDAKPAAERKPAAAPSEPPATGDDEPEAPAEPGVRADGEIVSAVDWYPGSLDQALADATHGDKLIVLDIGAYWCPPCHELDEKTFTDPSVGAWLGEHAIAIHVDAEKGEGPDIVERYDVQAYPTLLVLEGNGVEKGRLVDFIEPAELIPKLEAIAAGDNVLTELEGAVESDPDALEPRFRLAHAYLLAAKRDAAEALHRDLLVADPKNELGYAAKVLYDQALFIRLKLDADPGAAIAAFEALQTKFPDSPEAVRAHRMIGRARCKLGQEDQAVAALEAMLATDPEDLDLVASFGWFAFRQGCGVGPALAAVVEAIPQRPEDAELRYLEAELHRLSDQPIEALAAIRKASELEPDSAYYKRQVRRFEALTETRD